MNYKVTRLSGLRRHRCTELLPEQLKKSSYSLQITCFDLTLTEKHTCQLHGRMIRLIKSLSMRTIIRTVSCLNDDRRKARFKEKHWSLEVLTVQEGIHNRQWFNTSLQAISFINNAKGRRKLRPLGFVLFCTYSNENWDGQWVYKLDL